MNTQSQERLDRVEEALVRARAQHRPPEPTAEWRQSVMRDIAAQRAHGPAVEWVASGSAVLWPFAGIAASMALAGLIYLAVLDPGIAADLSTFYFSDPADYYMVQLVGL